MKKNVFGRQFKRDINERKALFKGLMTSLVMHDRIQTTEEKAKAIRGSVEKLVTKAKTKGINATPLLLPYLRKDAVKRMLDDIAPRFVDRAGGYTRIIRLGRRFGDNASVVIMEWVEKSRNIKVMDGKLKNKSAGKSEALEASIKKSKKKVAKTSGKKESVKRAEKKTAAKEKTKEAGK